MGRLGRSVGAAGAACAAAALIIPSAAQAQRITPRQVSASFVRALSSYCLPAILAGKTVADVPTNPAERLSAASPDERKDHPAAQGGGTFWKTSGAPGLVFVSEPQLGVCRVVAHRLLAKEAIDASAAAVLAVDPAFRELAKRATDADTVERRFARMEGDRCLVVLMSGSLSGSSGVLLATVAVAQPQSLAYKECLDG